MPSITLPTVWTRAEARKLGRMLFVYGLVGVIAGLAAVVFQVAVEWLSALVHVAPIRGDVVTAERVAEPNLAWLVVVVPAAGGLISGLLSFFFARETMGSGVGEVIDSYHNKRGAIRHRVPFVKALASIVTIGSGGSAGYEGPVSLIGAGFGAIISDALKLSASERRLIVVAAMAAGVGAIFHAPMAAAILAAEILYAEQDLEAEVMVPSIIACTIAYASFGAVHGWELIWVTPDLAFDSGAQLVPYTVLAAAVSIGAIVFIGLVHLIRSQLGDKHHLPLWLRPAIGGLCVGLIGLAVPGALGTGYELVQLALNEHLTETALVLLAVAKMLTSALTTGSGGSGGFFAPALIIGGLLGALIGNATQQLWPALEVTPAAFVVVGMAGFAAAVLRTPLASVIMVSELIGDYRLIVPALWVCVLAWVVTTRYRLLPAQIGTRIDAPAQLSEMMGAVLSRITVRQAIPAEKPAPVAVPPSMPLRELMQIFAHTTQSVFPIVDPKTTGLLGVVDGQLLRRRIGSMAVDDLLIANDFQTSALSIRVTDTLLDAITLMSGSGYNELVVVAGPPSGQRLVGLISRREIVAAYHQKMIASSGTDEVVAVARPEFGLTAETSVAASVRRGAILPHLSASTPGEALVRMVAATPLPIESDRARLVELLLERESLGSTAIGSGFALPHPHADDLEGIVAPIIAIGMFDTPIEWNALDEKPVRSVCLLLAPSGDVHLAMLSGLARALMDPTLAMMLESHATEDAILNRLDALEAPQ
ncbi:MAG: CIC family chloride channel protein [Myxococcota bacterium]|jgi:CIC family chloride channel protein